MGCRGDRSGGAGTGIPVVVGIVLVTVIRWERWNGKGKGASLTAVWVGCIAAVIGIGGLR